MKNQDKTPKDKTPKVVKRTGAIYNAEGKITRLEDLEAIAEGKKIKDEDVLLRYPHLKDYTAEQAQAELDAFDAIG